MTKEQFLGPEILGYHFYCTPMILPHEETNAVFQYLLDEHSMLAFRKKPTLLHENSSTIVKWFSLISKSEIDKALKHLEKIQFITITDDGIEMNIPIICGIATAFENLPSKQLKNKFVKALNTGDYNTLTKMGYKAGGDLPWLHLENPYTLTV